MPVLNSKLRSDLDGVCQKARDLAEAAARSALQKRAVDSAEPFPHFTAEDRDLRNRLRARGRQLGDVRNANKTQSIDQLTQELAYEYWHRMLFARFLAENHLLMHPDGVAVSLAECDELAAALPSPGTPGEGQGVRAAANGFVLAARYASKMLPQIFRTDDVLLEIEFPVNDRLPLEKLLNGLPVEVFTADDSLGWVYQFWQSKKKDEVNKSGQKIDGRTLPAVTQLFTEHYMVQFLLHNTIGAWWAGRQLSVDSSRLSVKTEEEARRAVEVPGVTWEYLRFVKSSQLAVASCQSEKEGVSSKTDNRQPTTDNYSDNRQPTTDNWLPAAGTFAGWPKSLKDFTMLDPCCGSGHFLVAAFNLLVPLRMHDEGLAAREACDAVLRENLFGLELDPRCTQIAAFALAVAAWKYPEQLPVVSCQFSDNRQLTTDNCLGFRQLPPLNIACTGMGPQATEAEWLKLAEQSGKPMSVLSREPILNGLRNLYALFSNAPTLGSLIDPSQLPADLITADYETLQPYLAAALMAEQADDDAHERAVAAAGMVKAAELLAGEYTLVATNVPYLGRGKQDDKLRKHLEKHYAEGKADLATAFVLRCLESSGSDGSVALVAPQSWLYLTAYTVLREHLLKCREWNLVARLGPGAFDTISGHIVNVALLALSAGAPGNDHAVAGLDVSAAGQPGDKAALLGGDVRAAMTVASQRKMLDNPNAAVRFDLMSGISLLSDFASTWQGLVTTDDNRYVARFWELAGKGTVWEWQQSPPGASVEFTGRSCVVRWEEGDGALHNESNGHNFPSRRMLRPGVAVRRIHPHNATLFGGDIFHDHVAPVVPNDPDILPAIWCFLISSDYEEAIANTDQQLKAAVASFVKVPFNLPYWQAVAAERYPNGLPEPESDDPTQWLFHGRPEQSTASLQVAVARLLGYRWPAELEGPHPNPLPEGEGTRMRLSARARELVQACNALLPLADKDGIVCIPAVRGEEPAAGRLLEVLQAAYGSQWSNSLMHDLLTDAGCKPGTTLDDWLRNAFFEQHCKLFHSRPFVWHIWDGHKDGFSCLVNYHKLNYKTLENLIHSYLRDWIALQAAAAKEDKTGADLRLAAAHGLQKKLELILQGEPPYDIFVRWKPLHEQPIGWNPDLNDGVRLNIRPFVTAGVLRKNPNIKWTKDRGKEPERDREQYPWFWKGKQFTGERVNDVHLTNAEKQLAVDRCRLPVHKTPRADN